MLVFSQQFGTEDLMTEDILAEDDEEEDGERSWKRWSEKIEKCLQKTEKGLKRPKNCLKSRQCV